MSTTLLKQDAFTGLRESHEAQEAYRGYLDAADPGNRLVRRRYGLGGSGDWHLQPWQLWYVREQCYHAARNDGLPGQVTERLVDQVLGNNFRLEPNTGDTGMDRELKDRWACFTGDARLCDHDQLYDWDAMTWHAMLNMVLGGDHFGVGTQDGQIQMIEASRCVSPAGANGMNSMVTGDLSTIADPAARTYNGVTLGRWGGIDGYTFSRGVPLSPYALNADYFPRYNEQGVQLVFHTYSTHRCTQHRGYPWWTPILADMGMLSDLDFAMLLKAQMAASVAGVAESDKEASGARLNLGGGPAPENVVGPGGDARLQFKLAMGSIMALPPGVHYKAFTAAVPNSEHFEHVRHTMKRIGGALHLPLVVMLLDASETNFSGWRGAVDTARQSWRRIQREFAAQWHRPIYRWWLYRQVPELGSTGKRLAAFDRLARHKWLPSAWRYIQPKDDAEADTARKAAMLSSPSNIAAESGHEYHEIVTETVRDNALAITTAIAKADELTALYPDAGIVWRDLLPAGALTGVTKSAGSPPAGGPSPGAGADPAPAASPAKPKGKRP